MTTLLVVAVLLLCSMALMGVRFILQYPTANSTPAWVFMGASVVLALKILLSMLQTEFARRDLKAEAVKTRHDLKGELQAQSLMLHEVAEKTNGGLTRAVHEVGEQVRIATHDQMMDDPACMKVVTDAIEAAAVAAADKAEERMRRVIAEMQRGMER